MAKLQWLKPTGNPLPEGWLRALAYPFQAALYFQMLLLCVAFMGYLSAAGDPALASTTWLAALRAAGGAWGMTLGAGVDFAGGTFRLLPLGAGLALTWAISRGVSHCGARSLRVAPFSLVGALVGQVILLFAFPSFLSGSPAKLALVYALGGVAWGLRRAGLLRSPWPWLHWCGQALVTTLRGLLVLSGGLLLVALVVNFAKFRAVWESLNPGFWGGAVIVFVTLAYLPNLMICALAWVSGPGFAVGQDTLFSPGLILTRPLPALPPLTLVPTQAVGSGTIAIPILAGLALGVWFGRRAEISLVDTALGAALYLATGTGAGLALTWAARGSLGPQLLSEVGPSYAALFAGVLEIFVPFFLAVVLSHRQTLAAIARFAGRVQGHSPAAPPSEAPVEEAENPVKSEE